MPDRPTIPDETETQTPAKTQVMKVKDKLEQHREEFIQFASSAVSSKQLFNVALLAISETPKLAEAPFVELVKAFRRLFALGLEVNSPLGHAYLIPFKKGRGANAPMTIQVVIGYQGLLELCYRSGHVRSVTALAVTEGEVQDGLFKYQFGTDGFLHHEFAKDRDEGSDEGRNRMEYVWAMAELENKVTVFTVMNRAQIERIRDASAGYRSAKASGGYTFTDSPWVRFFWQQAQKTVIKRLLKYQRKSAALAEAISIDDQSEAGVDILEGEYEDLSHKEQGKLASPAKDKKGSKTQRTATKSDKQDAGASQREEPPLPDSPPGGSEKPQDEHSAVEAKADPAQEETSSAATQEAAQAAEPEDDAGGWFQDDE